jgi:hypothetical protein
MITKNDKFDLFFFKNILLNKCTYFMINELANDHYLSINFGFLNFCNISNFHRGAYQYGLIQRFETKD